MTAYSVMLFLHSWMRWAVVITAVLVIVQAFRGWSGGVAWDATKARFASWFVNTTSIQLVLGLVLYGFLSPVTLQAFSDMGGAMKDSVTRFWAVEHMSVMLVAVALAHIGAGRVKKAADDQAKHRAAAIFFTLAIVLILLSIPWAGITARPLFRFDF
ncbi:MAG: hypothetical protein ACK5C8_10550 [Roseiflexaceae bacterium]|jgi:uncharacterized membrane protein YozB (DUF420 family)|nr:hypothetical protein [Chloroflexaceae bacterium]